MTLVLCCGSLLLTQGAPAAQTSSQNVRPLGAILKVVLYKVQDGKRTDLPLKGAGRTYGMKEKVPARQWGILRVVARGNLFEVFHDGKKLYEVEDDTFKDAGKVGVWTKADSVIYFDDLQITVL